jgi:hypothetical protein
MLLILLSISAPADNILDNEVSGTKADSIHMARASHDIVVQGNKVSNSGDDGIAVVSYRGQEGPVKNITITGNSVTDNAWGEAAGGVGAHFKVLLDGKTIGQGTADTAAVKAFTSVSAAGVPGSQAGTQPGHQVDPSLNVLSHGASPAGWDGSGMAENY